MKRVLLGISTSRYSQHLVNSAIEEAKGLGGDVAIDVLYVYEDQELNRVSQMVGNEGFLGLEPQAEVIEMLGSEHNRMAMLRVDEVREAAAVEGMAVDVAEVRGSFAEEVHRRAEQTAYDVILITRSSRPFISRLLFGSEAEKVAKLVKKEGLGRLIIDES